MSHFVLIGCWGYDVMSFCRLTPNEDWYLIKFQWWLDRIFPLFYMLNALTAIIVMQQYYQLLTCNSLLLLSNISASHISLSKVINLNILWSQYCEMKRFKRIKSNVFEFKGYKQHGEGML